MVLLEILVGITTLLLLIYVYSTWTFNYWKKRGVPCLPPIPVFGSLAGTILQTRSYVVQHKEIYDAFPDYRYCGYYAMRTPCLFIRDPDLVKTIFVKDFESFHDNGFYCNEDIDPLMGKHPFFIRGDRWKMLRNQIRPAFSSGKVKTYFPNIVEVTERLVKFISENMTLEEHKNGMSAKDVCSRYTVDVVVASSLGINARSFEHPKAEFREMGRQIMAADTFMDGLRFFLVFSLPKVGELLRFKIVKDEVAKFFMGVVRDSVKYRKDNNIVNNDFLEYMIQLRSKCTEYDFNEEHMTAQILTFFTDGSETTATVLSYLLYELGSNPEVQRKLQRDVDKVLEQFDGEMSYEAIQEMFYLECVITETLRKHPPGMHLRKLCTTPYTFPAPKGDGPGLDVEVGTPIVIPVYTIQHDETYFPNPEKFDPDRFSEERKHDIHKNAFMPFGDGPRSCVGTRLALIQMKAAVVNIVRNFNVKVNSRTDNPLLANPAAFMLSPLNGIWVDFTARKKSEI